MADVIKLAKFVAYKDKEEFSFYLSSSHILYSYVW